MPMNTSLDDLHMGAVYLSEIGDDLGLEELRFELVQFAADNPERAREFEGLLESFEHIH